METFYYDKEGKRVDVTDEELLELMMIHFGLKEEYVILGGIC